MAIFGVRGLTRAQWGIPFLLGGIIAYGVYPMYRNLTFQFKVYIQMSGMTVGSMIEADKRMRDYEATSRRVRKLKRDQETWKAYEAEYEKRLMSAKDNH